MTKLQKLEAAARKWAEADSRYRKVWSGVRLCEEAERLRGDSRQISDELRVAEAALQLAAKELLL